MGWVILATEFLVITPLTVATSEKCRVGDKTNRIVKITVERDIAAPQEK